MTAHFCTSCGAPLPPEAHFCTACGQVSSSAGEAAPVPPPAAPVVGPPAPAPQPVSAPAPSPVVGAAPVPGPPDNRKRNLVIIGVVAALLLIVGVVAVVALTADEASADVALEPVGVEVPDPFTATVSIDEAPLPSTPAAVTTSGSAPTTTAPSPGAAGGAVVGSAPGLYGGTRDAASCDPEKMVTFLQSDTEKAEAWAEVQGIEAARIPEFVADLTPVVLRRDTRVLNHGYRNGKATPIPAVLQAGTAVMVDDFGVPRVKCGCGNPLAEPEPVTTSTRYTGTKWDDFRPANVVVVRQDVKVDVFVLVDVRTGDPFRRPTGSKGDDDANAEAGEPTDPTTTTTEADTTTSEATTTTEGESEGTGADVLFQISSIAGVSNNPTAPSVAELPASTITAITTYHWNDATGATPGTIGLQAEDGTIYGPFQATGSPGQGGVPNANWTAVTNFDIPAGTYTVIDSSPETWAWAPDTGGRGMVAIYGRTN